MENGITCIYLIVSPSNRYYVGQTRCLKSRISLYRGLQCKSQRSLYASLKKYGFDKHKMSILVECKKEDLNNWEIFYINLFNSTDKLYGLNLKYGGSHGTHGEETRLKISKKVKEFYDNGGIPSARGRSVSEETKEKLRKINLGKTQSEETKQKKRDSLKLFKESGRTRKKYSFVWTDERRQMWSEMGIGEKNGNYGKKHPNLGGKPVNQLTKQGVFIKRWESAQEVQRVLGISASNINGYIVGLTKYNIGGFKWERANN